MCPNNATISLDCCSADRSTPREDALSSSSAATSPIVIALYITVFALLATCLVGTVFRARNRSKYRAAPDNWLFLPPLRFVANAHPIIGIFTVLPEDPYSPMARCTTLAIESAILLVTTALLPLINPTSFSQTGTLSTERLTASALSVTISTILSVLFASPLVKYAFHTDDPVAHRAAFVIAAIVIFLLLLVFASILVLTAFVDSLPFTPLTTVLLFFISLTIDWVAIKPSVALATYNILGKTAIYVRTGGNGGINPAYTVAPATSSSSTSSSSLSWSSSTSNPTAFPFLAPDDDDNIVSVAKIRTLSRLRSPSFDTSRPLPPLPGRRERRASSPAISPDASTSLPVLMRINDF